MKKQLIGLSCAALLAGVMSSCSLIKAKVEEPVREGDTYVVKMASALNYEEKIKARGNAVEKLGKNLKKAKVTMTSRRYYGKAGMYEDGVGEYEFFENGAYLEAYTVGGEAMDGVDIPLDEFESTLKVVTKDGYAYTYECDEGPYDVEGDLMVHPFTGDITQMIGAASFAFGPGTFGTFENGNGVYYYIDTYDSSMSGYDKDGNPTSIRTVEYEETLVLYSGDCITGDPVAMYSYSHEMAYCDENQVVSATPTLIGKEEAAIKFEFGKRRTMEKTDEFIKGLEEHPVICDFDGFDLYSAPATLSSDGKTLESVGTLSYEESLDGEFTKLGNNGSKATGFLSENCLEFDKGYAYRIDTTIDFKSLIFTGAIPSVAKSSDIKNYNSITVGNNVAWPQELKVMEYGGATYIYAVEDVAIWMDAKMETEVTQTEMGPVVDNKLTVTKAANPFVHIS
ncbi:MAG: hypothetical protein MJ239_04370 [Bacilli bacterium]|nr:hypothetical protein [Bacilli bacterium]